MADTCVHTTGDIKVEYGTSGSGTFHIVDSAGPTTLLTSVNTTGATLLKSGGSLFYRQSGGTSFQVNRDAASGDVAAFNLGGAGRVKVADNGTLVYGGANSGHVFNVHASAPGNVEEGLCYVRNDSGTFYFAAYLNGGWRESDPYT